MAKKEQREDELPMTKPEGQEYDTEKRAKEELKREKGAGRKPYITPTKK